MTTFDLGGSELLCQGIVGSTAYGLATEDSDVDRLGLYMDRLPEILAMGYKPHKASKVFRDPDAQFHEIGKFLSLVCGGNPTVTELLFLDGWEHLDPRLSLLVDSRLKLLGARRVRDSYIGYATDQAKRLLRRSQSGEDGFDVKKKTGKHGRHCWRLLHQGADLLRTGSFDVNVAEHRDEIFAAGRLAEADPQDFYELFKIKRAMLDQIVPVIDDEPDYRWVNDWLFDLRIEAWGE